MNENIRQNQVKEKAMNIARIVVVVGVIGGSGFVVKDMIDSNEREQAAIDLKCGGPERQNCTTRKETVCGVFSTTPTCSSITIYEVKTPTTEFMRGFARE